MIRQLVLVHGGSQEHKDSAALKAEWIGALKEGLAKNGLTLPISEHDVRFPYYGDTLYDMVEGKSADTAADVILRGEEIAIAEKRFTRALMEEINKKYGISEEEIKQTMRTEVIEKGGPLNWEWFQGFLIALDRHVPYASGASIALFTHDVYQYLHNRAIREHIEEGVNSAITPGIDTVVVSHSLGTVVSFNLLHQQGHRLGWRIPLFVTLGSPLAVTEIKNKLKEFRQPVRCPECVTHWFNAMDEGDVVALYPLDSNSFPLDPVNPAIENKTNVHNHTDNRHGIEGYLDDRDVAKRIYDALTA